MEEKVSIIFGGTSGIGLETAKELFKKDIKVYICGKDVEEAGEEIERGIGFFKLDLKEDESIKKIINEVFNKHSKIDSVIYSVSPGIKNKLVSDTSWDEFQEQIDVQIKGFFQVVNLISKLKIENKVKFVIVITEYVFGKPPARISAYVTAKYGLMGLVKSLASEMNPKRYTFNMVSPGMTNTKLLSGLDKRVIDIAAYNNPMKRIGSPTDVARTISFLVSEDADYLNGVNILINGGNIFA